MQARAWSASPGRRRHRSVARSPPPRRPNARSAVDALANAAGADPRPGRGPRRVRLAPRTVGAARARSFLSRHRSPTPPRATDAVTPHGARRKPESAPSAVSRRNELARSRGTARGPRRPCDQPTRPVLGSRDARRSPPTPRQRLKPERLVCGRRGRTARTALVKARQEVTKDDPNRSSLYDAQRPRTGRFCFERGASAPQGKPVIKLIAKK